MEETVDYKEIWRVKKDDMNLYVAHKLIAVTVNGHIMWLGDGFAGETRKIPREAVPTFDEYPPLMIYEKH
jgi:hypothetical protein